MNVYDTALQQLCSYRADTNHLSPSFLYDFDGDGKQDMLFGSISSENLTITAVNGCGDVIAGYDIKDQNQSYSAVLPQCIHDNVLYSIVREGWPNSPRGLLSQNLPQFNEKWTFMIPSDPMKLSYHFSSSGQPIFTISHITRDTGMFRRIGIDPVYIFHGDMSIRLFQTDSEGTILCSEELRFAPDHQYNRIAALPENMETVYPGAPMPGRGEFFPLGSGSADPFLLVQNVFENDGRAPYFFIHLLERQSAGITVSCGPFPGFYRDLRIIPDDGSGNYPFHFIILSESAETAWRLDLLSPDLTPLQKHRFESSSACLGPVTPAKSDPGRSFFFFADSGALYLYDFLFTKLDSWPSDTPREINYIEDDDKQLLVSAGKSLEIWEIE